MYDSYISNIIITYDENVWLRGPQEQTAVQRSHNIYIYLCIYKVYSIQIQVYAQKCKRGTRDRLRAPIDSGGYDPLGTKPTGVSVRLNVKTKLSFSLRYLLGRGCLSGSPLLSLCSFSLSFVSFSFSLAN